MKKRLLILLLCVSLLMSVLAGTATAAPTPDTRLEVIRILGILVGDPRGDLMLERPVTRAQFIKMMVAASPFKDNVASSSGTALFKDVKSSHWASGYIKVGVDQQWLIGYVDGTFRPDKTITLEEGCTALLRALGYTSDSLVGAYPSAQLTKAEAIGLREDLPCKQGQILTRRDCVTLMYNALTASTATGQTYGTSLGCTISGDEIDYASLVKIDTKGPFVSADGRLELPFTQENLTVYRDGRISSTTEIQPEDVYYYHANLRTVWAYSEKVTGIVGGYASGNLTLAGKSYPVTASEAVYALSGQGSFRKDDLATVLLGKDNDVVSIRMPTEAERTKYYYEDSPSAISDGVEGPYVVENGVLELPFDSNSAVFYRNGRAASASDVTDLDVYYYHKNLKTVWLYRDWVNGTLTAVGPNKIAPTTATVSGITYNVTAGAAAYALSSQGTFRMGDSVTLLLGMNGDVVRVLPADTASTLYYGMVLSSTDGAASESTGTAGATTQTTTQVVCSDGTVRTFYHTGASYGASSLVSVSVNSQGTALRSLGEQHLSGTVTTNGVGPYKFADNVEILDTDTYGNYAKTYVSRLLGAVLQSSDVRYYTVNSAGKIDRLILNEVTGDLWDYCFITKARVGGGNSSVSASYTYYKNGQPGTVSGSVQYPVNYGGAAMIYGEGKLKSMRQLSQVPLVLVSDNIAIGKTTQYKLSENVQLLIKDTAKPDTFYAANLEDTDLSQFDLTGWYDNFSSPAGSQIRVILALPKN